MNSHSLIPDNPQTNISYLRRCCVFNFLVFHGCLFRARFFACCHCFGTLLSKPRAQAVAAASSSGVADWDGGQLAR